jgi:hypothetical protein
MKGYWHLFFGAAACLFAYYFVRIDLGFALTSVAFAMIPDFDLLIYAGYKYEKNEETGHRELKYKTGIGGHRDGIFHSAIFALALFVGYTLAGASAEKFHHCGFFAVAMLSHLLCDFKNCKGRIRFLNGKLKLRGRKSTAWLLVNCMVLGYITSMCF